MDENAKYDVAQQCAAVLIEYILNRETYLKKRMFSDKQYWNHTPICKKLGAILKKYRTSLDEYNEEVNSIMWSILKSSLNDIEPSLYDWQESPLYEQLWQDMRWNTIYPDGVK